VTKHWGYFKCELISKQFSLTKYFNDFWPICQCFPDSCQIPWDFQEVFPDNWAPKHKWLSNRINNISNPTARCHRTHYQKPTRITINSNCRQL